MKHFSIAALRPLIPVLVLAMTGCDLIDPQNQEPEPIAVASVTIDRQSLELKEGETATLTARIQPSDAQATISWSSSKPSVASVSDGKVTAIAAGSATITASAGGKSATCEVTVKAAQTTIEVTSVKLDRNELTLKEGETSTLKATVKPDNATDKTVSWSTSNPAIVTVDKDGNVKGVSVGTATVAAAHGNLSDACKITVIANTVAVTSVTLNKSSLALAEQETFQLSATVKPDNATDKTVTWSSSKTAVATVSDDGLVTAVAEGSSTITAKAGDKTATCTVTVKKNVIAVSSISLSNTSIALTEQETFQLSATVKPDNATDKTVTWSSSNTSVATVSSDGLVTAVKEGSATITAKAGDKTATCAVTVKKNVIAVSSISLSNTSIALTEQDTFQLSATVQPVNATDKTVTWSSSNTAVATVSSDGLVTAVKEGSATITAKAGDKTATCAVSVAKKVIAVSSVSMSNTSIALTEQDTFQLSATVQPSNATDKTVTWSSSNTSVATVSNNGLVTAIKEGSATITAKAGDKTATCAVTVAKKVIAVTSVTLDNTSLSLNEKDTYQLSATVNPANATDKTVTWSSSNTAVATVSNNGLVTAVKEGSATITAKAGDKMATCAVTVKRNYIPATSITFDDTWFYVEIGTTMKLPYTVTPANADEPLTWTSSAPSYVSVDQNGVVTAKKVGAVTITVTGANVSATCNVSGCYFPTGITLNATTLSLEAGDQFQMEGTVTKRPEDNSNYGISWASSDPTIASISSNGLITARAPGVATIRASTWMGVASTCTVTVTKKTVYVTSITLDRTSLEIARGDTYTLQATVLPEDAVNKTVTWTSSNKSVATVDSNGKVTGVKAGTATITAKAGDRTATCEVKVIVPVTSVTLNLSSKTLRENETVKLTATVKPTDATYKDVTWTSDKPWVASVGSDGTVTALSEGTAIITASAGGQTATCEITVSNNATGSHEGTGTEVWY